MLRNTSSINYHVKRRVLDLMIEITSEAREAGADMALEDSFAYQILGDAFYLISYGMTAPSEKCKEVLKQIHDIGVDL